MQNDTLKLISGAYTGDIWSSLEDVLTNENSTTHIYNALKALHDCGKDNEAFGVVRVLYDIAGITMPDVVETLDGSDVTRRAYIAELLMDIESII